MIFLLNIYFAYNLSHFIIAKKSHLVFLQNPGSLIHPPSRALVWSRM